MKVTEINFFDEQNQISCDELCDKAWGINSRPKIQLSEDDEDDYCFLADSELEIAPSQSSFWEGGDNKPICEKDKHNKWCVRECERATITDLDESPVFKDFSQRQYNYNLP